jgi:hypothetical protein
MDSRALVIGVIQRLAAANSKPHTQQTDLQ